MSIPKVIHYCWFGGNPIPESMKEYIESWKKYCPDYEIIEWNERNFDIHSHPYIEQAYGRKRWAFVTDVARLLIVYRYGGVYLDTDVELIRPLDELLDCGAFFGYEKNQIATGLGFGAEAGNPWVKAILDDYENVKFVKDDGVEDTTPCTYRTTKLLLKMGLKGDGSYQELDGARFLPMDYLCPFNHQTGVLQVTEHTFSIHHYAASWWGADDRFFQKLMKVIGVKPALKLRRYYRSAKRMMQRIRYKLSRKQQP